MNSPTVVFDLDGTLVDTAPDLAAALNYVFRREGLPPVPYAQARNMVGGGARVMIERGLTTDGRLLPAAELDRLMAEFITYYAAHIAMRHGRLPDLRRRWTSLPAMASGLRSARTNWSGCRGGCSTRSG